jgi:uncharacterized membrane protein (DUF485 family)
MRNIRAVTVLAAVVLYVGLLTLGLAGTPLASFIGKIVVGASLIAFGTIAATYVLTQGFAAHALRNEDFHWY